MEFLLAFYPTTNGYAFVLFEGPLSPFDWAVSPIRFGAKNEKSLKGLRSLLDRYHPAVLVIEDATMPGSRRSQRVKLLYEQIEQLAGDYEIPLAQYSWPNVQATFRPNGAITKHEIAESIAALIPAFSHRMPRQRKIWMNEDPRQSLFDAAALGLTHFAVVEGGVLLEQNGEELPTIPF